MNSYGIPINSEGYFVIALGQKRRRCDAVPFIIFQDCQRCDLGARRVVAKGQSEMRNISLIDRGHDNIEGELRSPGAHIERVWE